MLEKKIWGNKHEKKNWRIENHFLLPVEKEYWRVPRPFSSEMETWVILAQFISAYDEII